jgi:high-affinity Fe2+/Pb2+ permease
MRELAALVCAIALGAAIVWEQSWSEDAQMIAGMCIILVLLIAAMVYLTVEFAEAAQHERERRRRERAEWERDPR